MAILRSSPVILIASATRLLLVANYDPVVATKIASSGGVTGTLLGTLIPLLPVYLPIIVVMLIVTRRFLLALAATGSMVLVSPARTSLDAWIDGMRNRWHTLKPWLSGAHKLSQDEISTAITHVIFRLVSDQWPLWIGGTACIFAFASAPKKLHWRNQDEMREMVKKKIEDFKEGWTDKLKVSGYRVTERDRSEWRDRSEEVEWRKPLLDRERRKRLITPIWRALYGIALATIAVPLVGLVMQFYVIPVSGVDPGRIARSVWLPTENITVKTTGGQTKATVGYVLATNDKWFVVLTEKHRTIEYIQADSVTARNVCSVDSPLKGKGSPLVELAGVADAPSPPCPNAP
jgi:hypothetical protein